MEKHLIKNEYQQAIYLLENNKLLNCDLEFIKDLETEKNYCLNHECTEDFNFQDFIYNVEDSEEINNYDIHKNINELKKVIALEFN
jgi:hypothetical protein